MGTKRMRAWRILSACLSAIVWAAPVQAFVIDTGDPDIELRWDNTVRYSVGLRTESRDERITNNALYDESDLKFDSGDLVTNRLDLLTEMDLVYRRRYGLRFSAQAWYDAAYDEDVRSNPRAYSTLTGTTGLEGGYRGGNFSGTTRRYYRGPSSELLDAFAFSNLQIGETPLNLTLGRHTVYWGEAIFTQLHGISYSQSALDGRKGAATPGASAKELFLPLNQISAQSQVSDRVSLAAQYFFEWKPYRLPEAGTYFAHADIYYDGPDGLPVAPGLNLDRRRPITPDNGGDWGVNLKWNPELLDDGLLGFYYRKFGEKLPWLGPDIDLASRSYRLAYARDVQLYGISLSKGVGPVSLGAEISYRRNTALNNRYAAVGSAIDGDGEGPLGNTWQALINGVWLLPPDFIWDSGDATVELVYSRLDKVTKNKRAYSGEGYDGCPTGRDRHFGCSTRDYWGLALSVSPKWLQALPGVDLSVPLTYAVGLAGNAPTLGSSNEGYYTWSAGLQADIYNRVLVTLQYADSFARFDEVLDVPGTGEVAASGNGLYGLNDRGWVSLTVRTTF